MLPIRLSAENAESERARYKVVRLDTMADACPGALILAACCESGLCIFRKGDGTNQEFSFGPGNLRIVPH